MMEKIERKLVFLLCLFSLNISLWAKEMDSSLPYDIRLEGTKLSTVLESLEECFPVEIETDKEEGPLDLCFLQGQDLEEILEILAEFTGQKLEKISDKKYRLKMEEGKRKRKRADYQLRYLKAEEASKILTDLYAEDLSVSSLGNRNRLILLGEAGILEDSLRLLEEVDQKKKQVRVEVQFLDITEDLFHELGFDWFYQNPNTESDYSNFSVLTEPASGGKIAPLRGNKLNLIRQFSNASEALGVSLRLLEAKQDLKISSSPSILISNGEVGEFKITEEVIVGEKKEKGKEEQYYVEPVFKEAGLILKVKPQIYEDKSVSLHLEAEMSSFQYRQGMSEEKEWNYNSQGGSKLSRSLETEIHLEDNETVMIGGLSRESHREGENKFPILGDIPGIRHLFRSSTKQEEISELYIKISVSIMD